ncbi:hypothetical protein [Streptomyces spiralis]
MTKPVAGLAVMALVERGAPTLDSTVGDFLPGYRDGELRPRTFALMTAAHTDHLGLRRALARQEPSSNDGSRAPLTSPRRNRQSSSKDRSRAHLPGSGASRPTADAG